jgi:hypothetical protein
VTPVAAGMLNHNGTTGTTKKGKKKQQDEIKRARADNRKMTAGNFFCVVSVVSSW